MPEGVIRGDEGREDEGERAPAPGGDGLHGHDEGVRGEVPRVGHGVLLPELREDVLGAREGGEVEGVVAFEEEVDGAALVGLLVPGARIDT